MNVQTSLIYFTDILTDETILNRIQQAEIALHNALVQSYKVRSSGALQYPGCSPEVSMRIESFLI